MVPGFAPGFAESVSASSASGSSAKSGSGHSSGSHSSGTGATHRFMEAAKTTRRSDLLKLGRAPPLALHTVVVATAIANLDTLKNLLEAVSDPYGGQFGKHLSQQQVRKLTANPSSVSALLSYCALHGVELLQRTPYDDYITLQTTVGHWEELLNTEFYQFAAQSPPDTNAQPNTPDTYTPNTPYNPPPALFARALHYSLPLELSAHVRAVLNTVQMPDIDMVRKMVLAGKATAGVAAAALVEKGVKAETAAETAGGTEFSKTLGTETAPAAAPEGSEGSVVEESKTHLLGADPKTHLSAAVKGSKTHLLGKELSGYVTPSLLLRQYGIEQVPQQAQGLGSQALYETIGQTFSPSDLAYFQQLFELPQQAVAVDIGGHESNDACVADRGNNCVEANLDVQYMMAVAQSVPTTYYYWGGDDFLLDWVTQVASMSDPPKVFSISYGIDEWALADSYAMEFDIQAMKLGVMGVTILASSGDDGAVSSQAADPLNC
eukprot:CAMPEP_0173174690 /NCGR_PEP_ID=MMETSP1141-20130122/3489_1 /TAXON_ID=483371 /ORGANISM="non described non described, Strain CCMP2298" /LENGTH=491 /DNA_ID=CAMNT_0014096835 /DNA_START=110 /DNA_END=1582 /DNA_ORIENTATION=+